MTRRFVRRVSQWEEMLALHIKAAKLPEPVREYQFTVLRKWRIDFAWPDEMVAAEVEGVTYYGRHLGRHQTCAGMARDCEKYNALALNGWRVFRFTPDMVKSGNAVGVLEIALRKSLTP